MKRSNNNLSVFIAYVKGNIGDVLKYSTVIIFEYNFSSTYYVYIYKSIGFFKDKYQEYSCFKGDFTNIL